jgi:carotenoid cleavage dioxygenase
MSNVRKKYNRRDMLRVLGCTAGSAFAAPLFYGCADSDDTVQSTTDSLQEKFWLHDNYAPVGESESFNLTIEGSLPPSLLGSYLRVGPNPSSGDSAHLFLGDGMVHGVRLEGGSATMYRARYPQTRQLENGPWAEKSAPPLDYVPANTSLIYHADKLLALTETGLPYELLLGDLSSMGVYDFNGRLKSSMTAHPKIDPQTGELIFFGNSGFSSTINYHVASREGVLVHSTQFELLGAPVFMHDFHVTATRSIFWDCPVVFDRSVAEKYGGVGYRWNPDNGTRVGVLSRYGQGSEIKWFDVELGNVSHTVNAYDDPNDPAAVILDAVFSPHFWVNSPVEFRPEGKIVRFRLNTASGNITKEVVLETSTEFPRINERNLCYPYRYTYSVENPPAVPVGGESIVKTDFTTGDSKVCQLSDGVLTGELIFVPDNTSSEEDEGWLIGFAHDSVNNQSRMNVFDATDITSGPIAIVRIPTRVPWGFHGTFVNDA